MVFGGFILLGLVIYFVPLLIGIINQSLFEYVTRQKIGTTKREAIRYGYSNYRTARKLGMKGDSLKNVSGPLRDWFR